MNKDKARGVLRKFAKEKHILQTVSKQQQEELRGGNNGPSNVASRIYHFSVVQLVTQPSIECEAEVDLVLIQTSSVFLDSYGNYS